MTNLKKKNKKIFTCRVLDFPLTETWSDLASFGLSRGDDLPDNCSTKDETKNARLKVVVSFTIPKDCYSDENSFLHVTVKVQKNPTIKSKNNDSVPKSSYGDQYSI